MIHVNSLNGERAQEAKRLMDFSWAKYKTTSRSFQMCRVGEEERNMNSQEIGLRDLRICPPVTPDEADMIEMWAKTEFRRVQIKGV